ncbi:MAG: hypothetical protein ACXAE3_11945 [Candidatus Kariarchaeaceae archaeon]|jgi:hypothetical protein
MSKLRNFLYKLSESRTYFIRGHSNWLAYPVSLLNFVSITFYLLIENLTIIPEEFKLFRYYILFFVMTYIPGAIIIGYLDMTRGAYRVEQKIAKELSPIWRDVFEQFSQIERNQALIMEKLDMENKG